MLVNWIAMIVAALKFLLGMVWHRSGVPSEIFFPVACDVWMVLTIYWLFSALRMKAVKSRETLGRRLGYVLPIALGLILLFSSRAHYSWLGLRFAPDTTALAVSGVALTAAGAALAMWARFILGDNWSAVVSIRKDHELIRIGPYRTMRHPIYTGLLLALLGTALVVGEVRGLLAVFILALGFYGKARREEALLTREFGAGFAAHARQTGMFLPRV